MKIHIPSLDEYDLTMGADDFDFEAELKAAQEYEPVFCPDCGADWSYHDPETDVEPCGCQHD